MTGEIENRSPVVLKLSKSVWNRSATRSVTRSSQPHNCGGDDCKVCLTASIEKLELTIMKLKRRPGRNERKSEDVVRFVKGVLQSLPIEMRRANIRTMPASEQVCISYEDMAAHVVGLRLEYVQRLMRPLLQRFIHHPRNNSVFNSPVDVVALNIPDYLTHVKEPMDLSCVKSRLQSGGYESLKQCARDTSLVFRNAMDYNADDNPIHLAAKSLNEDLEADLRAMYEKFDKETERRSVHSCGACSGENCLLCGEKCLKLESPVLVCHGNCNQRIKRNSFFYISTDALDVYCQRCYGNLPSVVHSNLDRNLLKRDLLKRRVDEEVWESWIACDSCDGWVHKICALAHDHPEETTADAPFHCPLCRFREAEKKVKIPDSPNSCFTDGPADDDDLSDRETSHASYLNCAPHSKDENSPSLASSKVRRSGADVWRASTLPASALSNFIEAMLAARLRETGFTDLMERLTVRVTSNVNEQLCVPAPVVNNFVSASGELIASVLPYRQKSVLLFQRIDGVDVCLFSLYVQEFDSSCPEPNRGKVYVAYLDSVEFFTPWEARTIVFHEVLVAYLKWAQARGFDSAHIWACPPQRGDNFIFWCHPNHQRTPSRERLNNWYLVMLQRCERLGIVGDISNLWNTHFAHQSRKFSAIRRDAQLASHQQNIEQPICPPLFEGDFWVLECLRLHRAVASRANCLDLCGEERGGERIARDILKELLNGPMAHLFAHPVNVQLLNIPTYPDVIKNPMDLGTVRSNLRQGKYPSLYEFLQDVNLTFSNARTFNPPGHFVHEAAVQLLRTLDSALSRLLGYDQVSDEQLRAVHIRDSSPPLVTFEGACVGLSSSTASLQSFDCQDSLNSPTFANRSMSFDSLACGEKCADDEDIYAGRPLLPSTNFAQGSTAYRSNTERTELGPRGTQLLMTDLCKSIARLKDDLFVVTFAKPGASNKRPRSNSGENIDVQPKDDVVVPTPQPVGGKPRSKVPAHLLRVAKKPVVNHYAVPKDKAECVDKSCALLLEPLIADTSDPDPLLDSPFVKSRHTFLEMCQFRHYQFDTLRRAKHSSLMMLYHLHQGPSNTNGLRPHCASCSAPITELRWHCDQCVDVDFCVSCVEKTGHASAHEHPLTPFRVSLK